MSKSEPAKIITPFADSGLRDQIPANADNSHGRAGYDLGFPPSNMTLLLQGGIPPKGQDMNGILFDVTSILQYMQAGGQPTFDADLAAAIGGYPKGSMVLGSDGVTLWQSKVDSNSTDPNTDPANWGTFDIGLKEDLAAPGGAGTIGSANGGNLQDVTDQFITLEQYGVSSSNTAADNAAAFKVAIESGHQNIRTSGTYEFDFSGTPALSISNSSMSLDMGGRQAYDKKLPTHNCD
ncbi:hypothetical protein [Aeromonas sp.]|uniref:hypothetical protein n=1 Tax=Aeromonas sp. TaxID=647 RepID=UPI00258E7D17|nr:hypothetical protein [Aeromonas sp.]MCX7132266.1 hypothetical protein [Aeromonas sp.]